VGVALAVDAFVGSAEPTTIGRCDDGVGDAAAPGAGWPVDFAAPDPPEAEQE